jgi:propanediol dehydratase small subunit
VAKKKLKDIDVTKKKHEYKAVGNSLKDKGKLTLSKHFLDAAELIELQQEKIAELEAG